MCITQSRMSFTLQRYEFFSKSQQSEAVDSGTA